MQVGDKVLVIAGGVLRKGVILRIYKREDFGTPTDRVLVKAEFWGEATFACPDTARDRGELDGTPPNDDELREVERAATALAYQRAIAICDKVLEAGKGCLFSGTVFSVATHIKDKIIQLSDG